MNIKKFLRPGKSIVIELDDEVEYLLDDTASSALERGDAKVALTRLVDRKICSIESGRIEKAILNDGAVDYLPK